MFAKSQVVLYNPARVSLATVQTFVPHCTEECFYPFTEQQTEWFEGRLAVQHTSDPFKMLSSRLENAAQVTVVTDTQQCFPDPVLLNALQVIAGPQYDLLQRRYPSWAKRMEVCVVSGALDSIAENALKSDWQRIVAHIQDGQIDSQKEEQKIEQKTEALSQTSNHFVDASFGETRLLASTDDFGRSCSYEQGKGRASIQAWVQKKWAFPLLPEFYPTTQVLLTAGATQALSAVLTILRARYHTLILPRPCYPWYLLAAQRLGFQIRFYDVALPTFENSSEVIDLLQVEQCLEGGGVFLANFPHNPTGVKLCESSLKLLKKAVKISDSFLMSDEVYRSPNDSRSFLEGEIISDQIVIGSFSKMLGVGGARVGFCVGNPDMLAQIEREMLFQSLSVGALSFDFIESVLERDTEHFSLLKNALSKNRKYLNQSLESLEFKNRTSEDSPFAWLRPLSAEHFDDVAFCHKLLDEELLKVTSGTECGLSGFLRVNLNLPEHEFKIVADRLQRAFGKYQNKRKVLISSPEFNEDYFLQNIQNLQRGIS